MDDDTFCTIKEEQKAAAAATLKGHQFKDVPRANDTPADNTTYRRENPDGSKISVVFVGLVGACAYYWPPEPLLSEPTRKEYGSVPHAVEVAVRWLDS